MASFVISVAALERNAHILHRTGQQSGAHILLALKAFATTSAFAYLKPYAAGCCASGLYEARLAAEHFGGHVAVYSPAYREDELRELLSIAHHIDFNSLGQWQRYRSTCLAHPRVQSGELQLGLRVNPCYSTGHTALYDACAPGSRLGIPAADLAGADLSGISGLHFHTLCEQGAQELIDTFRAFENVCAPLLASPAIRYLNLGGGHWITKPDYDRESLISLLREIRAKYAVEVYLEPGEAWCIHTGVLRAQVLDIFESLGYRHAILDVSVSAHMPDVLEMPYRPAVYALKPAPPGPILPTVYLPEEAYALAGEARKDVCICLSGEPPCPPAVCLPGEAYTLAGKAGEAAHTYRLGAPTCLAGDVLGDYSFPEPLHVGDTLVLDDMTHYTIVKTTHFNGVPHPDIALLHADGRQEVVRHFTYADFESRLG